MHDTWTDKSSQHEIVWTLDELVSPQSTTTIGNIQIDNEAGQPSKNVFAIHRFASKKTEVSENPISSPRMAAVQNSTTITELTTTNHLVP